MMTRHRKRSLSPSTGWFGSVDLLGSGYFVIRRLTAPFLLCSLALLPRLTKLLVNCGKSAKTDPRRFVPKVCFSFHQPVLMWSSTVPWDQEDQGCRSHKEEVNVG